jgi:hypothetical protein
VIPPLPRFMFSGCCSQPGHSGNVQKDGHAQKLLTDTIGLRNCLKKFVASLGLGNCRVLDSCCVTDCATTANITVRLDALRTVTANDSVHFSSVGYDNLVRNILRESITRDVSGDKRPLSSKTHFWRGFRSTVGAAAVTPSSRPNWPPSRGRGSNGRGRTFCGGHRHHPSIHTEEIENKKIDSVVCFDP